MVMLVPLYRFRPVLRNQLKGPRAAECDEYFLANHTTTHESGVICDRELARLKSGIIAIKGDQRLVVNYTTSQVGDTGCSWT